MRTPVVLAVTLLAACEAPAPSGPVGDTAASGTIVATIAELRTGDVPRGIVEVEGARVVSGPTADGLSCYLQDRETGEGAELRLGTIARVTEPIPGTPVRVRAYFDGGTRAPVLWLIAASGIEAQGDVEPLIVALAPSDPRPLDLATWAAVTITSSPDPTGAADTSVGRALDDRFGVPLPDLGNVGALTGIVTPDGAIAPRTEVDWLGTREPATRRDATIDEVRRGVLPVGALVRLAALQATPWTRDGRATLLQDEVGRGIWLDTEAFGHGPTAAGDVVVVLGEVRSAGGTFFVRAWTSFGALDHAIPIVTSTLGHGALVDLDVSGLGAAGWVGERSTAQGWMLDDRFRPLGALPDPAHVRVAVDASTEIARLAVVAYE